MGKDLYDLAASAILTFVMVLVASLIRARAWTPAGLLIAFSNRDNLPEATPLAGRAERERHAFGGPDTRAQHACNQHHHKRQDGTGGQVIQIFSHGFGLR